MAEPAWDLFAAIVIAVAIGVVGLARASAALIQEDDPLDGASRPAFEAGSTLFLNLAITHLGIAVLVGALAWLTAVPGATLGVGGAPDLVNAVLVGVGLYAVNEGLVVIAKRTGEEAPERYREFLAPANSREWVLLLVVVLPAVAFAEELLFRGALVGGLAAATAISPWVLLAVSSVAFGISHTAQGRLGIVVTGFLGFLLGAVFVLTGDLLLVALAHYLVNALEFLVHEGLGFSWAD